MAGAAVLGQQVFELRPTLGVRRRNRSCANEEEGRQNHSVSINHHGALQAVI
jgi:hypothetical protein